MCENLEKHKSVPLSWSLQPVDLQIDLDLLDDPEGYPITVTLENKSTGTQETIYAKYVVGCDGAHSWLRKHLKINFVGDLTDSTWGK